MVLMDVPVATFARAEVVAIGPFAAQYRVAIAAPPYRSAQKSRERRI
jgi:hypothetical protein